MTRLFSWNVNGLRACISKGFWEFFDSVQSDFFCVQETKMHPSQLEIEVDGYWVFWNSAEKKGYSGTAIFTKYKPIDIVYGIGMERHDHEGRVITLEYRGFYLVNVYTPNSQDKLQRLNYRMEWEDDFFSYLSKLDQKKPVILCGDLNVAHCEIDLKNPKSNRKSAGFTDEERGKMDQLLSSKFVDTFRKFYPNKKDSYTWWSYRTHARARNAGWRIDYFIVSKSLCPYLEDSIIHDTIMGSDHCPIELKIKNLLF